MLGNTGQDLSTAFGVVLYSKIMNQEGNNAKTETLQKELLFTVQELKQEGRAFIPPQLRMCTLGDKFFRLLCLRMTSKAPWAVIWELHMRWSERANSRTESVNDEDRVPFPPWCLTWYLSPTLSIRPLLSSFSVFWVLLFYLCSFFITLIPQLFSEKHLGILADASWLGKETYQNHPTHPVALKSSHPPQESGCP